MESRLRSTQSHATKCLLCRAVSSQKLLNSTDEYETLHHKKDPLTYNNWAKSCIESITKVLKIPSANSNFLNASYCQDCVQLMRDVNFTSIQLDNFKRKIKNLRQELLEKLRSNYDAIPNKDRITVTYSNIEIPNNSKNRYTLDEVVKMVYEEIEGHNKEWRNLNPIEPTDKHTRICIKIRKYPEYGAVEPNKISINENDFNSKETRSQRHRKSDNYDEQEMQIDEVFSLNAVKTEEYQQEEDCQGNDDADWILSNAESGNSPTPNDDHEKNLPEDNYDNNEPADSTKIVYRCPINTCGGRFMEENSLLIHQRKVHERHELTPNEDHEKNLPEDNYDNNEPADSTKIVYRCPITTCGGRFMEENSLLIHQRKVHERDPTPYHCDLCPMKYKSAITLSAHVEEHNTGIPTYRCSDCGKHISSKSNLEKHKSRVHSQKFQSCSFCDKKFEKEEELIEHEEIHKTSEHPFNCTICLAAFTNSTDLRKHSRSHLDNSYICDTCGITLSSSKTLRTHRKIHDVNYVGSKCEVCGHVFRSKSVLERHMSKHSDDKKFICDVCGSSFKYNSGLKVHLRNHNGVLPYVCKICGKGFALSHNLKHHEEIHSGSLSYECPVCQKIFKTNNNFQQHIRTHEPKNPNAKKRIRNKKARVHSAMDLQTNNKEDYSQIIMTNPDQEGPVVGRNYIHNYDYDHEENVHIFESNVSTTITVPYSVPSEHQHVYYD